MVNYNNLTGMIMEKNLFLSNFKTIFNSIFNWFDLFIIYFSIEASAVIQDHKKRKTKKIYYNASPKKGFNHPHIKYEVLDPFDNRNKIAKVAKVPEE